MHHLYAVKNITELTNLSPTPFAQVRVAGYRSAGDGGGGNFVWDSESTQVADHGLIFQSKLQPKGRWLRQHSGPIDVRSFGVLPAGGDVSPSLQRALDACKHGGTLYIPSGNYTVSSPLKVHQGTNVLGDGLMTEIHYSGPKETACWNAVQHAPSISMAFRGFNTLVHKERTSAFRLTGMSYSRFDQLFVHLRVPHTFAYFGPSNGQSPYYNVFTNCHASGPGGESNGCIAFNWGSDDNGDLAANANQVFGGHINSVDIAVRCQGTGNIFHGQVLEMVNVGYEFDLPPKRYDAASKGTSNDVMGLYTEYAKVVFEQKHEACYLIAQTCMVTGHEILFKGKNRDNCVLLSSHSGQLPMNRSFFRKAIDFNPLEF